MGERRRKAGEEHMYASQIRRETRGSRGGSVVVEKKVKSGPRGGTSCKFSGCGEHYIRGRGNRIDEEDPAENGFMKTFVLGYVPTRGQCQGGGKGVVLAGPTLVEGPEKKGTE